MSYWNDDKQAITQIITTSGTSLVVSDLATTGNHLIIDGTTVRSTDTLVDLDQLTFSSGTSIFPDQLNNNDIGRILSLTYSIEAAAVVKISMTGFIIGEDRLRYDVALVDELVIVSLLVQNTIIGIDKTGAVWQDITFNLANMRNSLPLINAVTPAGSITMILPMYKHVMRSANIGGLYGDYLVALEKGELLYGVNYIAKAGTMSLSRTGGTTIGPGANYALNPNNPNVYNIVASASDQPFLSIYRDGAGGWNLVTIPFTAIPLQYDDNSGVLAAIPANRWIINLLYYNRAANINAMLYGQTVYTSLTAAKEAYLQSTYTVSIPPVIALYFKLRTALIIKWTATDLTNLLNNAVYQVGGAQGGGASSTITNHASLLSLDYLNAGHIDFQQSTQEGIIDPIVGSLLAKGSLYINSVFKALWSNLEKTGGLSVWYRVLTEDATQTSYHNNMAIYPDGITKLITCKSLSSFPIRTSKALPTPNRWYRICTIDQATIEIAYLKLRTTLTGFTLQSPEIILEVNTNIGNSVGLWHSKTGGVILHSNSMYCNCLVTNTGGYFTVYINYPNIAAKNQARYEVLDCSSALYTLLECTDIGSTAPAVGVILNTSLVAYNPNESLFLGHLHLETAGAQHVWEFNRATGIVRSNALDNRRTIYIYGSGNNHLGDTGTSYDTISNGCDEFFTVAVPSIASNGFTAVVCNFRHTFDGDPFLGRPFVQYNVEAVTADDDLLKYVDAKLKAITVNNCTINVYNLHDTTALAATLRVHVTGICS